jgi:hypothetical protein
MTIAQFCMGCGGACVPGRPGGPAQSAMGPGRSWPAASPGGTREVVANGCWLPSRSRPRGKASGTWSSPVLIVPSFVPTAGVGGQKGDTAAEALEHSQVGFSTKLHLQAEGYGKPLT